jgi:hypothetical protein
MTIAELKHILTQNPAKPLTFVLPDREQIPAHFHITEVGHVQKEFIDCGGTRRSSSACVLQAWVAANDEDHALSAGKLAGILDLAGPLFPKDDLAVEVEFEAPLISQFPILSAETSGDTIVFQLATKHTDCLAKEQCGLESASSACCSAGSGCCE